VVHPTSQKRDVGHPARGGVEKQEGPGLKPGDLCATYRGLKPAANPKDKVSESAVSGSAVGSQRVREWRPHKDNYGDSARRAE